jgi:hypothetical protein
VSSASVIAEIADSSGNSAGSIWSWSMTTDVSRSPRVGSAIEALVYYRIEVRAKSGGVDARGTGGCICKRCSEYESARLDGPQLRYRRAVACHYYRAACLNFAKHGGGLIAKLALRDGTAHSPDCSTCSTL